MILYRKLKHFLRIHLPFARAGISVAMAYKLNFIGFVLGDILNCVIVFFLWSAVFAAADSGTINGFSRIDMTAYVFVAFLTTYLTYSDAAWALGDEIRDGSIAMRLIKPIDFEHPLLFQEMGDKGVSVSLVTIPTLIGVEVYRYVSMGKVMLNVGHLAIFFLSVFIGYLVNFYFNLCFGFLSLLTQNIWGLMEGRTALVSFLSGNLVPIVFLPEPIAQILSLLPFASFTYTPAMIYLGKYDLKTAGFFTCIQLAWFAFFFLLSKLIWHLVKRRLCVQGG